MKCDRCFSDGSEPWNDVLVAFFKIITSSQTTDRIGRATNVFTVLRWRCWFSSTWRWCGKREWQGQYWHWKLSILRKVHCSVVQNQFSCSRARWWWAVQQRTLSKGQQYVLASCYAHENWNTWIRQVLEQDSEKKETRLLYIELVFKRKRNGQGTIQHYQAWHVVCGIEGRVLNKEPLPSVADNTLA